MWPWKWGGVALIRSCFVACVGLVAHNSAQQLGCDSGGWELSRGNVQAKALQLSVLQPSCLWAVLHGGWSGHHPHATAKQGSPGSPLPPVIPARAAAYEPKVSACWGAAGRESVCLYARV
jgi:hypothetical protein